MDKSLARAAGIGMLVVLVLAGCAQFNQSIEEMTATIKRGFSGSEKQPGNPDKGAEQATSLDQIPSSESGTSAAGRVAANRLNLRQAPSTKSSALGVLRGGTEVQIISRKGSWLQITTSDGRSGWVAGRYVKAFDVVSSSIASAGPTPRNANDEPLEESSQSSGEFEQTTELSAAKSVSEGSSAAQGSSEQPKPALAKPVSPSEPDSQEAVAEVEPAPVRTVRVFRRMAEPRENAFTLLVPKGWRMEGGIFRLDPTRVGGPRNAIEAKIDLALKNDASGRVMMRRLPDWYFADVRHMPAGQMGLFPPGSNYQGMTVLPVMSAAEFIRKVVIPKYHPGARNLQVVKVKPMPEPARKHQQRAASLVIPLQVQCDAALVTVQYDEGGVRFKENIYALIENKGAVAGGEWANRETGYARAPASEYAAWEPVFHTVMRSVKLNPRWVSGEVRGMLKRANILHKVQDRIHEIDRQMLNHQQRTNQEIQNDMYLTLTGQEEYINPYTKEVEVDSGELGKYRWQTEGGDILFSDREGFDPNPGGVLNRTDWRRSRIRPRFPE